MQNPQIIKRQRSVSGTHREKLASLICPSYLNTIGSEIEKPEFARCRYRNDVTPAFISYTWLVSFRAIQEASEFSHRKILTPPNIGASSQVLFKLALSSCLREDPVPIRGDAVPRRIGRKKSVRLDEPMNEPQADSLVFRKALLLSEQRRILGVIVFLFIFATAIAIRIVVFRSSMSAWGVFVISLALAYELLILRSVNVALKKESDIPNALWFCGIVLEMSIPALGIAYFSSPSLAMEYRPLATPWVLAFFPFIMLSVLRSNPLICNIAGVVAAFGYLSASYYLGWRINLENLRQHTTAQTAVLFYAAILLASGFFAGMVAREIRKHLEAALNEAKVEGQLKQVEHDLEIARSIQQSLLPRIRPNMNGLEISGWNLPADATGGDYFDWKRMRDGRLVVTLADVTGHGIGPALLASVCRAYARSSFDTHDDIVHALQHINRFFGEDLSGGRFATFVAAVCTEESGQVALLSAGHGPLFVYSSARDIFDKFVAQAIPLGLLPDLNSGAPLVLNLEPGDLIVLATDGFFEWENEAGEQFGVERLIHAVREARHLPPEEIIVELYNAVKAFVNGTKQMDDLTAVVIKRVTNGTKV
jgi:serine phosphatase RsbU (regulator of sigma subunit)